MSGFDKRPHGTVPLYLKIIFAAIGVVAAALVVALIFLFSDYRQTYDVSDSDINCDTYETVPISETSTTTYPPDAITISEYITVVPETSTTTTTKRTTTETTVTTTTTTAETTTTVSETEAETTTTAETTTETTTAPAPTNDTYDKKHFSNDLFIGDSIYTGLYLYDYFPNDQVFAKIGLNPQSARITRINGYSAVRRATEKKPVHIFIMLGTNGLAYMSPSFMADELELLVGELKEASPDSAVYVVSIPPVTKAHEQAGPETMEMVNNYNSMLKTMCDKCDATYLDLCSQLQDDSGYFSSLYAEADGMHFLGAAYKRMLAYFYKETQ